MTPDQHLSGALLDELFPFHFTFDHNGVLGGVGPALRRICPEVTPGGSVADVLRLQRPAVPFSFDILGDHVRSLVVVETASNGLRLRGQFVEIQDGSHLLFAGTPWVTDLSEMKQLGLMLEDFPPHSAQAGSLFLLRSSQVAVEDARGLVRQLNGANLQLRAILETAAEGIIVMGSDGIVRSFNAAATEIFGYRAEEVLGKNVSILMPPEVAGEHDGYVERYLETGVGAVVGATREVLGIHKEGHTLALELAVSEATVGEESLFTGILRDLLERKRAERNHAAQALVGSVLLRAQAISEIWSVVAEPLAAAFGFDFALFWLRPSDSEHLVCQGTWTLEDGRFDPVSEAAEAASYGPGAGPAGPGWEADHPTAIHDLSAAGEAHHIAAAACGLRSAVFFPVYGEKGILGAVELIRVGPLRPDPSLFGTLDTIGGSIGLAVERARALRLAEESVRAREEFLAHMSHEIRTPLSAVIGLAYLLENAPMGDPERATVARLRYSAEVLRGLVNDVLDFAKLTGGQLALIPQEYPLPTLLLELTASQEALAHGKGISLTLDADAALPPVVITDSARLTQVLLNLVNNAIKFTDRGGVTVRAIPVDEGDGATYVRFSVEDTGVGISDEDRDRIFEAYTQAEPRGMGSAGGTGLGLAIVRRLVALMDGVITVESTPGVGSTFSVTLPLRIASPGEIHLARPAADTDLSGLRILVADDSEMNRFVAARILGEAGADIVTVGSGADAVERTRAEAFDLVLMDLQMPGMDGYEAARAILSAHGAGAPPVAALTARATVEDRQQVEQSGMVDMITKPFHPDGLKERVAQLARRETASEIKTTSAEPVPKVSLIDRSILMIQGINDPAFMLEILGLFQVEAHRTLDLMEAAAAAGETDGLEGWAHTLKSQAGVIGAVSLQGAMEELETRARSASGGGTATLLPIAEAAVTLGRAVLQEAALLEQELSGEGE